MSEQLILLYSKYSKSCAPILEFLRREDIAGIHLLCIDNREVRKKVMASRADIKAVPCFLMLRDNRLASKFEGDDAHMWFASFTGEVLKSKAPPPPPSPPPPAPIQVQVQAPPPPVQQPAKQRVTPIAQPPQALRTPIELPDDSLTEDDIMNETERASVSRTMAPPDDGRPKELNFNMAQRPDRHQKQEMEDLIGRKEEMSHKKKIRGLVQNEPLFTDGATNFSGRDMIEHDSTAARTTGGNKTEDIKAMVEEMRRGREMYDNELADSDGVPRETLRGH